MTKATNKSKIANEEFFLEKSNERNGNKEEQKTNKTPTNRKYKEKAGYHLNEDLKNNGWLSDEDGIYVPVFNSATWFLKLSIKNNGKFLYQFVEKQKNSARNIAFKALSTIYSSDSPITESNTKRDSELGKFANTANIAPDGDLEKDKKVTKKEIQTIGIELLNADCLNEFKSTSSDYDKKLEEDEKLEENEYYTFNDYPEDIKIEALKIIERGNIMESLQKIVEILHEGDKKAGKILLLCIATLFIENANSVNEATKGSTGGGKSSLSKKTMKLVPKQYVQEIRDSSPKYVYYACEDDSYHDKYNIFFFDDIVLNDTMIEIIKTLTDNLETKKTLKTVKEQTTLTLEIPGKCLVILSFAKEITDEELNNRLFYNNPEENEEHGNKTKEKIRDNENMGLNFETPHIKRLYDIANAVMQYIIDKEIKVYNPYLELLELTDKSNREVGFAVNLIKANLFYNINNRQKIDGIYIGSIEDVEAIESIWDSNLLMQQHKIDAKQIELIDLLPEYSEDNFSNHKKFFNEDSDSLNNTFKALSKELSFAQSTLKTWVFGRKDRESNKPTMVDQDLVKAIKIDPEIKNSPYVLYRGNKEKLQELLESSKGDVTTITLDGSSIFNNIDMKKKIIYGFLSTNTNSKYLYNEELLDDFLDDSEIESYTDICNFIKETTEYLKEHIDIDTFTPETFDELIESLTNQSNGDSTSNTPINTSIDKQTAKTLSLDEKDDGVNV